MAFQSAGIAGAVKLFLVRINDLGGLRKKGNFLEHLVAAVAVLAHDLPLVGVERPRFAQNSVRNRHLADVVKERAPSDDANLIRGEAHGTRHSDGVSRDSL